jgi:hypothetical protein
MSLFDWLGLSGRVKEQAAYVAREFAGMSEDSFVEHVRSFKSRGIIIQRGDFVQVQPIPLAARLAAHRLSLLTDGKVASFFAHAPSELRMSLLRRLRWLDTSPVAQAFAKQLLHEDCLGNLAALNSKFGSECIDRLVHVEPNAVMKTIDRVLSNLALDHLREVKEGRRHVVWALEKLAFRKETFERAATLLRLLGTAEIEQAIANNAGGQFKELYQLRLSGTEASPEERLRVLDEGLQSTCSSERELCVEALGQMLHTGPFTRGGGAEEIGSESLEDWTPKTYGEIWNFHRAGMNRLADIATSDDQFAERAQGLLELHIRGLLNAVPFDDVKAMIDRVVAHGGIWPGAIKGVNSWLYFDRRKAPKDVGSKIRAFFDQLMPTDPVGLVVLYTHGWQAHFHNPDVNYDPNDRAGSDHEYSAREACKLAEAIAGDAVMLDNILDRLVTSDAKGVFPFARRLAELVADPVEVFGKGLRIAETSNEPTNRQFFGGLITGTDQRDSRKARECVRAALQSPKLKNDAISLIGSGKLQPDDLRLVVSLLQSGDVEPSQCSTLSYGRGLDHLSPDQIMPLLDELGRHGPNGHWAVMDIISMYLLGEKPLSKAIASKLKGTLLAHNLLDDVSHHQSMHGYHLEQMSKLLLKHDEMDGKFATALVKQLLSICRSQNGEVFYAFDDPVRSVITSLLASHPQEVWREASKLLTATECQVRFYAEHLFEPNHDDHLGPGLLYGLPSDVYLDWVRRAPAKRAEIVVEWLPVATTESDGNLAWHSDLERYVKEFGDQPRVLVGIATRLHPRTYWGSIALHIEQILPLLESWRDGHPRPEVRRWAHEQIGHVSDLIATNKKRDEEDDAGIY